MRGRKVSSSSWASTIPGRFPETEFGGKNDNNNRIYATATRDFETFTPTQLFFDPGFNCIDATILSLHGKFFMFFKDENKVPSRIRASYHLLRMGSARTGA